jgi:hypothetical protein
LCVAAFVAERDVRAADERWKFAKIAADARAANPDPIVAAQTARVGTATFKLWAPAVLAFTSLGSLIIVIALTRPRSRAFFDATSEPASE